MRTIVLCGFCLLLLLLSCSNDDNSNTSCEFNTIIDGDRYSEPSPSSYTIENAQIVNTCLEITIGASGCDASTWEAVLISDFPLEGSGIGGSNLSVKLTNLEICLAYFLRSYSFDLSEIHGNNSSTVFELEGWEGSLEISN